MSINRYNRTPILDYGKKYGTNNSINVIRNAFKNGQLTTKEIILRGAERLDTLAGSIYGDASLWWILAATSNIGWGLQIPPGTIINIPDLNDIISLVG